MQQKDLGTLINFINPVQALGTPQLSGLRKVAPVELLQGIIRLLKLTAARFNLAQHKSLDDVQINFLANSILTHYWMFKIDEVAYVLREGISGRLHTFDHLDEAVVMNWFAEYDQKQCDNYLGVYAHAQRTTPKKSMEPIEGGARVYVLMHCRTLTENQLVPYRDQLAKQFPNTPEASAAVDEYIAGLEAKRALAEQREEEQRQKVKRMLAEFDPATSTAPNELWFETFEPLPAPEKLPWNGSIRTKEDNE